MGYKEEKSVSLSVDPWPLPPYQPDEIGINHRFGLIETPIRREYWSPSRLEAWLKCPRQAWLKQTLNADDEESGLTEDIDLRVRGNVVHDAEAALLQGHGAPLGGEASGELLPLRGFQWVLDGQDGRQFWPSFSETFTGWVDTTPFPFIAQKTSLTQLQKNGKRIKRVNSNCPQRADLLGCWRQTLLFDTQRP